MREKIAEILIQEASDEQAGPRRISLRRTCCFLDVRALYSIKFPCTVPIARMLSPWATDHRMKVGFFKFVSSVVTYEHGRHRWWRGETVIMIAMEGE